MLEFFTLINPGYCIFMSLLMIAMGAVSLVWYKKTKDVLFLIVSLVGVGLFYDMFITGIGYAISDLSAFEAIGMMRHVFHGLLTPLILVYVYIIFRRYEMIKHKAIDIGMAVFVVGIMVWAIVAIFTSPVEIVEIADVIRHSMDNENAHFLANLIFNMLSFGTLVPMGIGAFITIKKQRDFNLLWVIVAMFGFTIIGVIFDTDLIFVTSFIGEGCIMLFYFLYAHKQYKLAQDKEKSAVLNK